MGSRSSIEVEFWSLAQEIYEILWIKGILEDLKIHLKSDIKLYCDNKCAIYIVHNPIHHDGTKHIKIDQHFI